MHYAPSYKSVFSHESKQGTSNSTTKRSLMLLTANTMHYSFFFSSFAVFNSFSSFFSLVSSARQYHTLSSPSPSYPYSYHLLHNPTLHFHKPLDSLLPLQQTDPILPSPSTIFPLLAWPVILSALFFHDKWFWIAAADVRILLGISDMWVGSQQTGVICA